MKYPFFYRVRKCELESRELKFFSKFIIQKCSTPLSGISPIKQLFVSANGVWEEGPLRLISRANHFIFSKKQKHSHLSFKHLNDLGATGWSCFSSFPPR